MRVADDVGATAPAVEDNVPIAVNGGNNVDAGYAVRTKY